MSTTKDGNLDKALLRWRKGCPVGSEAFELLKELIEQGRPFSEAAVMAGGGLHMSDLTSLPWLAAPRAARDERAAAGRNEYHLEREVLTPEEHEAVEWLARRHHRLKKYFGLEPKQVELPVPEAEGEEAPAVLVVSSPEVNAALISIGKLAEHLLEQDPKQNGTPRTRMQSLIGALWALRAKL